ncbi:hypothetical protein KUTeg_006842, partial [Tegillarca granosa]
MIVYLVSAISAAVVLKWFLQPDPSPKAGIYNQKNKWFFLKYAFFRFILWHRKRQNQKMKSVSSGENAGYGMRSRSSPEDMDKLQELPADQPKAVDAVYFNGGNKDGQYIMAATARRQNNVVQTILYLRLPGIGMLEMPSLPDTKLRGSPEGKYAAGGLVIESGEPMKTWKISYTGKMRNVTTDKEVDVEFTLNWLAFTKYFDFDTDLHPAAMADAICREKWSREYFDGLKRAHQTHYEQFGQISGKIKISGVNEPVYLDVDGVRDHSYGNIRDWKDLHRYAIQYATLSDRTAVCVGVICMPVTMSRLLIGYVIHPDGQMDTVSWSDFELYNYGEDGNPPDVMSLKFIAGCKNYNMTCKVVESRIFYIGEGRDAKIHERFCTFNINGMDGWGISELDYRYVNQLS